MEFGSMTMTLGGRRFLYDPCKVTFGQGLVIEGYTGLGMIDWDRAVMRGDVKSVLALYWVVRCQGGDDIALDDIAANPAGHLLGEFSRVYNAAYEEWVARAVKRQEAADRKAAPKAGGSSKRSGSPTPRRTPVSPG